MLPTAQAFKDLDLGRSLKIRGSQEQVSSCFLLFCSSATRWSEMVAQRRAVSLSGNVSNLLHLRDMIKVLETSGALPLACSHWVIWG